MSPCKDTALSEQPAVHLLPSYTIVLNDWLVGYAERCASGIAPIGGVESYRSVLKRPAGTA